MFQLAFAKLATSLQQAVDLMACSIAASQAVDMVGI